MVLSYAQWYRRAEALSGQLQQAGLAGERVLLLFEADPRFTIAFMACLLAGALAVPLPPPYGRRGLERLQAVLEDCGARALIADRTTRRRIATWQDHAGLVHFDLDRLPPWPQAALSPALPEPDRPAFLQYTSGSTARPKGVVVTHGNLLHNLELLRRGMGTREDSVFLSWLPLFHDMGLIGIVLQSLYLGASCYLMAPAAFAQDPLRWPRAMSRYGATATGAPDFAYALCAQKAGELAPGELDLSRLELAFNGAEPVRAATLDAFTERFAPFGLRREALYPSYGMAEATLMIAGAGYGTEPHTASFDRAALAHHRVEPATGPEAVRLVSCGIVQGGQELRVVCPETHNPLPEDRVGEIWLRGASIGAGYWERPDASRETFGAYLSTGAGPFLRTGDLGFLYAGQLYVSGRLKDLIIIRGLNHFPQDIEDTVCQSHPDLAAGGCAAFTVEAHGRERLVVTAEVKRSALRRLDPAAVAAAVRRAVASEHRVPLDTVALLRPGRQLKTTSGKLRRGASRQAFLDGTLATVAVDAAPATDPGARLDPRLAALLDELGGVLEKPPAALDPHQALTAQGLDSLTGMALQRRLTERWGLALSLPTLLDGLSPLAIVARLAGSVPERPGGERRRRPERFPLSPNQRALWLHQQKLPASTAYNVAVALRGATLHPQRLRKALAALAAEHPILRTAYTEDDPDGGYPLQYVGEQARIAFERLDIAAGEGLEETLAAQAARPFELRQGPIARVCLLRPAQGAPVLLLVVHHIAVDLWSMILLLRALGRHYREETGQAVAGGETAAYADFVTWQEEWLAGPRGERLRQFWRKRLATAPPAWQLPAARPAVETAEAGAVVTATLPRAWAVKALARRHGVTPFVVLLAALIAALRRCGCAPRGTLGVATSGRERPEFQALAGYLVNLLPLTANPAGGTFETLLQDTQRAVLELLEHRDYPLQRLLEEAPAAPPPFRIVFVFQQLPEAQGLAPAALQQAGGRIEWGDLPLESVAVPKAGVPFELTVTAVEHRGGYRLAAEYRTAVYERPVVAGLLRVLRAILDSALEDPGRRLEALGEPLAFRLDGDFNAGGPLVPVHRLFAAQARRHPQQTALSEGAGHWSYAELDAAAQRIAARLQALGVGPGQRVALGLRRSRQVVAAVLGVLETGAAYVPVPPAWPQERQGAVLESAAPCRVLTEQASLATLPEPYRAGALCIDEPWPADPPAAAVEVDPESPAYVLFTSGTTGRPKGVVITQRSLAHYVAYAARRYVNGHGQGFALFTSLAFDLTVTSLFVPLVTGNPVVVFPEQEDSLLLQQVLGHPAVAVIKATPSHIQLLRSLPVSPGRARTFILGGEALAAGTARYLHDRFGTGTAVYNEYGPTEATVGCVCRRYDPAVDVHGDVPIGTPIDRTRVYLLDEALQPVPEGAPGELFIAGAGVAAGYLGQPDRTARSFLPDPCGDGGRMYRTGDLARLLPGGQLDYLGRRDEQVQWRGHRIELREIGLRLGQLAEITDSLAVVAPGPTGEPALCAYYTGPQPLPAAELQRYLAASLPSYMVPGYFVHLERIPLTANGKVDRAGLPRPRPPTGDTAPRTPAEALLWEIWRELLGLDTLGVTDTFTALGGDSIGAVRSVARLRERGWQLSVRAIFEHGTIERLAPLLTASPAAPAQAEPSGALPPGPMVRWLLAQDLPQPGHYHQVLVLECRGVPDVAVLSRALARLCDHHPALRFKLRADALWIDGAGVPFRVERFELGELTPVAAEAAQRRLVDDRCAGTDPARDPLLQATLFRMPEGWQLALACHHVAVDGVSWHTLVEDLGRAYTALSTGSRAPLPPVTAGPAHWCAALAHYRTTPAFAAQAGYWETVEAAAAASVPRAASALSAGLRRETLELDAQVTGRLQRGGALEVVLLAGLAGVWQRLHGQRHVVVELEHHGRHLGDLDLSRSVGWFTALFPLVLTLAGAGPGEWLARAAQALREVPDQGVGYGIRRFLHLDSPPPYGPVPVRLNYLGAWNAPDPAAPFVPALRRSYLSSSSANPPSARVEVNACLSERRLYADLGFHADSYPAETCRRFRQTLEETLADLAGYLERQQPLPTDADGATVGLSQADRDTLFS